MRAPRPERMKPPDSQNAMAISQGICGHGGVAGGASGGSAGVWSRAGQGSSRCSSRAEQHLVLHPAGAAAAATSGATRQAAAGCRSPTAPTPHPQAGGRAGSRRGIYGLAAAESAAHLVGECGEGGGKGERAGHHGGAQAQHGHRAQRQRRGDDARDGGQEDGQQVPRVGGHARGRRHKPQRRAQAHADAQLLQVRAPLDAWRVQGAGQRDGRGAGRVGLRLRVSRRRRGSKRPLVPGPTARLLSLGPRPPLPARTHSPWGAGVEAAGWAEACTRTGARSAWGWACGARRGARGARGANTAGRGAIEARSAPCGALRAAKAGRAPVAESTAAIFAARGVCWQWTGPAGA